MGYYIAGPPLLNGRCTSLLRAPVSEMTYTVSSGMLKSTIPYHSFYCWLVNMLMLLIVSVRLLMWMSYCWCCWLWVSDYWCECHIVDVVVDDVDQYSSDGNRADPECLHNRQQQHELSYLDVKLRFMFRLLTRCYLLTCTLTSETALIITSLLIVIT